MCNNKVVVKNMSYETTWKQLKDHMRKCGEVLRANIQHDEKGRSRGIGYTFLLAYFFVGLLSTGLLLTRSGLSRKCTILLLTEGLSS